MKKSVLTTKGSMNEDGSYDITHIKITKRIANMPENTGKGLNVGFIALSESCKPPCPSSTSTGYYLCASGNCVFVPFT